MHSSTTSTGTEEQTTVLQPDTTEVTGSSEAGSTFWRRWLATLKAIAPVYIATHIAFLLLSYLATLFILTPKNFSTSRVSLSALIHLWWRWDSLQYILIAQNGYDVSWRTAFFPLFPLLTRGLMFIPHLHHPFIAGMLISNLAGIGMLMVLYRLVQEDFHAELATRTILFLSIFPTAFFFAADYNETLFLLFALLSFYNMRHSSWWLAGLFGLLASLTRATGLLLLVPFFYEYLRQHSFQLRNIRLNIASSALIPAGVACFGVYCYYRFHDFLAFSNAQHHWSHKLNLPWHGIVESLGIIFNSGLLSFDSIHNVIDLSAGLFMLVLLVLCLVGPWKFPRELWIYVLYAATIYIFFIIFPVKDGHPLASLSRYVLEMFPAFIVLAKMGKKRQFQLYYITLSVVLLTFLLLQFLTDHWIV